jgi:hypothetical chaperone protein
MSQAIGIDFGTSNSTVGFFTQGQPKLIALEEDKTTIPSAVFYDLEDKRTLFGRQAISAYTDHCEGRLLRALKSILGSSLIDDMTKIGGQRLSFKSIIATFLGHLKSKTEQTIGHSIDYVVLGRPVWFVDGDPKADLSAQEQLARAARSVGFKYIEFQYEPIAAALDYEQSVHTEKLALIADIGGGTSDFSIVRVSPQKRGHKDRKSDILANSGVHVGGTDLDRRLSINQVMPLFGYNSHQLKRPELHLPVSFFHDLATWHKIMFLYNHKTALALKEIHYLAAQTELIDRLITIVQHHNGHRLAGDVEATKIQLSEHQVATLNLDYVEKDLSVKLQKTQFENDISVEKEKISKRIQECLLQANVNASQIQTLFLTGGTTSVPAIYLACKNELPCADIVEGDKLGSVGIGLSIDAATKFGDI